MTTTTASAIIEHLAALIETLTPDEIADRPFRRAVAPSRPDLRAWLPDVGANDMFRRFTLRRGDARSPIGILDPGANLVTTTLTLTVAYPAQPQLLGLAEWHELEALVESDATILHDVLHLSQGQESTAHHATFVEVRPLDRRQEAWYQDLEANVVYYVEQRTRA